MASIFKQQYTARDKCGKKVKRKSQYWYIDYKTAEGTRKRVKGFKDKQATAQLAAKMEKEAELAQAGIIDRYAEHRKKPLAEHVEEFYQTLLAKGRTAKHAQQTRYRLEQIMHGCKFMVWGDIVASRVQQILAHLRSGEDDISIQTSNYYLQAIKQFCRWMVQDRRASESPLAHLAKLNASKDRRHERRSLELEEIRSLLATTTAGPKRFGMTGSERALLYCLAAESGLRANELRSLKVSSFDFKNLTLTVRVGDTKNRKPAVLPLKRETAVEMREFFQGKMPTTKAFGGTYKRLTLKTADMLKADLADAGIPYVDNGGRYADFHSLRHTTGSLLAATGVHPKVAQSIMRHSDINLTMSRYTHTLRGQESRAIEGLPDLRPPSKGEQKLMGTDNTPAGAYKPAYKKLTKNAYSDSNQISSDGIDNRVEVEDLSKTSDLGNSLSLTELGNEKESLATTVATKDSNAPGRTRTCNLRIRSPRLYPIELRAPNSKATAL